MLEYVIMDTDFQNESRRLASFENWPNSAPLNPTNLSRAGFFYTGEGLKVRCAFCDVLIDDWTYTDRAIAKHRERSPTCPYVCRAYENIRPPPDPQSRPTVIRPTSNGHVTALRGSSSSSSTLLKESERRRTFDGWPIPFISPEDLARAGFVYLQRSDRVQCVFCQGVVGAWEAGDVPWAEHQRHFGSCPFVRQLNVGNVSIEDEFRGTPSSTRPCQVVVTPSPASGEDVTGHRLERQHNGDTAASKLIASGELNILPHSPAKHPSYKTRDSRLRTFSDWPKGTIQSPDLLAEAGFFYTGQSDNVKCFHCSGGLQNWELQDDPWEEHARWFQNCEFVYLQKGKEFIEAAKEHRPPVTPQLVNGICEKPNGGARNITEGEIDRLMDTEVAQQARALALDETKMRAAFRRRLRHAGYPFSDVGSLANAVLDLENLTLPQCSAEEVEAAETESCSLESEATGVGAETGGSKDLAPVLEMPVTGLKGGNKASKNPLNGAEKPSKEETDPRTCKICWDKDVCVVFLPCGHLVSCAECASALRDCPFCRQLIKGTVRTYWS